MYRLLGGACRPLTIRSRFSLGAYEPEHLEMLEFIEKFPDLPETPAQFQERCAQVALHSFWRDAGAEAERPYFSRLTEELMNGAR